MNSVMFWVTFNFIIHNICWKCSLQVWAINHSSAFEIFFFLLFFTIIYRLGANRIGHSLARSTASQISQLDPPREVPDERTWRQVAVSKWSQEAQVKDRGNCAPWEKEREPIACLSEWLWGSITQRSLVEHTLNCQAESRCPHSQLLVHESACAFCCPGSCNGVQESLRQRS